MGITMKVYEEVVNFIAAGTTPSSVIDFQPSEAVKARVSELIQREKNAEISSEEKAELDRYMQLEHIMRLAKARAHQYVING
jgi:lysyl-tRNA synthetase class I